MISNWFFMHRQARMKALQATFPDVQEDEEFKIGKRFNFPKPISEPPSPTSTRGMLYIKVSNGFHSIDKQDPKWLRLQTWICMKTALLLPKDCWKTAWKSPDDCFLTTPLQPY